MTSRRAADNGFTLIELVVAVGILGVIMSSVAAAFIVGLRTVDETGERLADSFDAQLVTRYLVADVQSAASSDVKAGGVFTLLTGCQDSTNDALRLFSPPVAGSSATAVRYELRAAGTTNELVRHHCDLATSTTPRSVTVAHDLSAAVGQVTNGVVELVVTTASGQVWTISSQPRPGRSLALPTTTTTLPVGTTPTLTALEIRDDDRDGYVETILATFNTSIACTGGACANDRWTLSGTAPSGATLGSVSVSGAVATLNLAGHSATKVTSVAGNFTVALGTGAGGIEAAVAPSGQSSFSPTAPADKAAPVLTGIDMLDTEPNGKVDRLNASFSETLASSTNSAPWTLTDVPSGGAKGTVSTSGSTARVNVTEGTGAADTAVGALKVSLTASTTGIRDAAGNQSQFSDAVPTDKASPVPVSVTSANAGVTAGYAEQGDTATVTFSEALSALTSTTTDVTLSVVNGEGKPVMLSVPGLSAAAFQIGTTPNYLVKNGGTATFTGSILSRSGSAVTVTLGATVASTRTTGSYVADATSELSPATAITDLGGNAAAGSILPTVRFF